MFTFEATSVCKNTSSWTTAVGLINAYNSEQQN